jgi:Sec-independent protein translocase protein TatA
MLFGAKKLPELSKGMSESVREVRSGFRDGPEPTQTADKSQPGKKSESTTKA